jgi:hypothetical protein
VPLDPVFSFQSHSDEKKTQSVQRGHSSLFGVVRNEGSGWGRGQCDMVSSFAVLTSGRLGELADLLVQRNTVRRTKRDTGDSRD